MAQLTALGKGIIETELVVNGDNEAAMATLPGTIANTGCTPAQSADYAYDSSTYSMKLARTAGTNFRTDCMTVAEAGLKVNTKYIMTVWVYIPTASTLVQKAGVTSYINGAFIDNRITTKGA